MKELSQYTNKELLQVIINDNKGELSESLLTYKEGGLRTLNQLNEPFLAEIGVSQTCRKRLLCAMELGRRVQEAQLDNDVVIRSSKCIFDLCKTEMAALEHEEFHVLYLNRSNRLLKKQCISKGGLTGTVVDVRLIVREALFLSACSMVLLHNHPSGNKQPSEVDIKITHKINQAAKFMDIIVIDHIIIADQSYYSFADDGVL